MRDRRSLRREKQFEQWLEERRWGMQTFTSFKDRCDAGEIVGHDIHEEIENDPVAA
tara:strand:+ start:3724 stop:3891 length:168 start_codon:yes stop_codon:yes gene_type:complete